MAADEKGPSLKASFLNVPASQYQIWTAPVEWRIFPAHLYARHVTPTARVGIFDVSAALIHWRGPNSFGLAWAMPAMPLSLTKVCQIKWSACAPDVRSLRLVETPIKSSSSRSAK